MILPSRVPENTGLYAINQLTEYMQAHFDFSYVTLMNLVRARNFVAKFKLSVPQIANISLTQKQIKFYEKQYEQFQMFAYSLAYELAGISAIVSPPSNPEKMKRMYAFSSVGSPPAILPGCLNFQSHFSTDFVKTQRPSALTSLSSTSMPVKLQSLAISDKLLIDCCEFLNSVYEEMFCINELISIKKYPSLVPEGLCLFYNGFLVVNSLQPKFLSKVLHKMKSNNLLRQSGLSTPHETIVATPEIYVDIFTLGKYIRTPYQQKHYKHAQLAEELVDIHLSSRFEEQKLSQGERGVLDEID